MADERLRTYRSWLDEKILELNRERETILDRLETGDTHQREYGEWPRNNNPRKDLSDRYNRIVQDMHIYGTSRHRLDQLFPELKEKPVETRNPT